MREGLDGGDLGMKKKKGRWLGEGWQGRGVGWEETRVKKRREGGGGGKKIG